MNSVFDFKGLSNSLGKSSAASFLSLIHSSRDEIGRYSSAIEFGLKEGKKALKKRDDKASQLVSAWFAEVEFALKEIQHRIRSKDFEDFAKTLEREARNRPWFSISARMILRSFLNAVGEESAKGRTHGKLPAR